MPSSRYRAQKTKVDGKIFDSIFESKIYELLKDKLPATHTIVDHKPIHIFDEIVMTKVITKSTWKVDFIVNYNTTPFFAIEAKGIFREADKYKFILWDIYQSIPLLVIYQGSKIPLNLRSSGWVEFVSFDRFQAMPTDFLLQKIQTIRRDASLLDEDEF